MISLSIAVVREEASFACCVAEGRGAAAGTGGDAAGGGSEADVEPAPALPLLASISASSAAAGNGCAGAAGSGADGADDELALQDISSARPGRCSCRQPIRTRCHEGKEDDLCHRAVAEVAWSQAPARVVRLACQYKHIGTSMRVHRARQTVAVQAAAHKKTGKRVPAAVGLIMWTQLERVSRLLARTLLNGLIMKRALLPAHLAHALAMLLRRELLGVPCEMSGTCPCTGSTPKKFVIEHRR